MNLSAEQQKNIMLCGLGLLIGVIVFWQFLIGPAQATITQSERDQTRLKGDIDKFQSQLRRNQNLQNEANKIRERYKELFDALPQGEPVAWFPPRIEGFFLRQGLQTIARPAVAAGGGRGAATDEFGSSFRALRWDVDFVKASYMRLGMAVASLENVDPLVSVKGVTVEFNPEDPEHQRITLTLQSLVRR
ncbi:MAG: hypothetical protein ACFCU3_09305 [Verrucomicrobiales bacterium]